MTSTMATTATLLQVALVRLPMVQKTTAARACSVARYWSKASRALKVKTSAMPSSTTVSAVTPRMRLNRWMRSAASIAIRKALIGTTRWMRAGTIATPRTSASAAPKPAAAEMPSVNGLASGLARIVCICAPATDKAAPTTTAISAIGIRICQITTEICPSTSIGRTIARRTSVSS